MPTELEDPLVEAYRKRLLESEPESDQTRPELRLRLAAAIEEIRRLRARLVELVKVRAALRGERDRLKAGVSEGLRIIDNLEIWNCPVCGSDYEKGQRCDPSCSLAGLRRLTDPSPGEG